MLMLCTTKLGLAYGLGSTSAINSPMAMNSMGSLAQMNSMGLGGLGTGTGSSMSNYYSINNMAASLLAQSKFCAHTHTHTRQ